MARAINQTIAWIASVAMSALIFAGGLGLVFMLKPKQKVASSHQAHSDEEHSPDAESAPSGQNHIDAAPDTHHVEAAHQAADHPVKPTEPAHHDEEEITADSFKDHKDEVKTPPHQEHH